MNAENVINWKFVIYLLPFFSRTHAPLPTYTIQSKMCFMQEKFNLSYERWTVQVLWMNFIHNSDGILKIDYARYIISFDGGLICSTAATATASECIAYKDQDIICSLNRTQFLIRKGHTLSNAFSWKKCEQKPIEILMLNSDGAYYILSTIIEYRSKFSQAFVQTNSVLRIR